MSISELERNDDAEVDEPTALRRPTPPIELYGAGQQAVDELMELVGGLGVGFERDRALDFGCGIGHATQALVRHFGGVDGVESAASMVDLATSYNQHGDRCRYQLHRLPHLRCFDDETFDFVLADGTLPQLRPDNQLRFISEFHRLLRPGGIAVFDVSPRYAGSMRRVMTRVTARSASRRARAVERDGSDINFLRTPEIKLQVELVAARLVSDRPLEPMPGSLVEHRQFVVQRVV
jgi:SAM-dependent methyltransferase